MKHIKAKPINILRRIAYGLALAACIGGFASITASATVKAKEVKADVVYRNGFVYTVDSVRSRAQAFAIKDGKFLAVGSNDDMKTVTGKNTKTVNLKGKMVMPGLVNTHLMQGVSEDFDYETAALGLQTCHHYSFQHPLQLIKCQDWFRYYQILKAHSLTPVHYRGCKSPLPPLSSTPHKKPFVSKL
jgi:hypothetical protein